ncbi:MAG TPA: alkaline phosphatase family protein [Actinomycetes bacterium]
MRPATFRALVGLAAAATLLAQAAGPGGADAASGPAPRTPIRHFIMLMQENHSFDNYFGTYPGADGIPAGTCMPLHPAKPAMGCVKPHHLGQGPRPDHSHDHKTALRQLHGGKLDGFVWALRLRQQDGSVAMGYYDRRDLPFHWAVADQYVLFDRFFSSSLQGGAFNHMFWVAGRPTPGDAPTIFDRLQARGISWKFYVAGHDPGLNARTPPAKRDARWVRVTDDVPILRMARFADDPGLASHVVDLSEYYRDLQEGTLPAVSFMVDYGASEHPAGNLELGQRLVRSLLNTLMASPAWKDSAFLYAYDDWGGWYDHVAPPKADAFGYGFRVPALLVSPYARRGYVDHTRLDQTAGIKFIEQNYGLEPLAARDAAASTFTGAFDFSRPPRSPSLIFEGSTVGGGALVRRPPSGLLYGFYAAAFAVALLVFAAALGTSRRRARATPRPGRGGVG